MSTKPEFPQRVMQVATWFSFAVIAVSCLLVLSFEHGRDQSIYALVARETLDGRMPYRDAFDFKPPGIFVVYAMTRAVFGSSMMGIRIVEVACMVGTVFGLIKLSELLFQSRTAGIFAGALASQIHAQLDFWHTAQPETFGGTMTVWALVLCARGLEAKTRREVFVRWLSAGILFGASGLMKPPLAGAGAIVAILVALREIAEKRSFKTIDPSKAWIPVGAMAVGGVTPIALTLAWFASKGALGDLHQVLFVFTPEYTKISWEKQSVLPMAYYGFTEWLVGYSSAMLTALVCFLVFRPTREEAPGALAVLACIFVHIAGIVMQGKFFPYHWGATFPLTAFLAGLGLEKALRWAASRGIATVAASVALFGVLGAARCNAPNFGENSFVKRSLLRLDVAVNHRNDRVAWDQLASIADVDAVQNRAVAEYVAANTAPTDPIFVWGFECAIYDLSNRPVASKFIYNVPQRAIWSAKPMQAALMVDLKKTPPAAIVVEHWDIFPMVTGSPDDSAASLWKFPELRQLMDDEYEWRQRIGDFDIYFRRPEDEREPPLEPPVDEPAQ